MKYEYWFAALQGLNDKKKQKIRRRVASAKCLYNIVESVWKQEYLLTKKEIEKLFMHREQWNVDEEYEKLQNKNIRFLPFFQNEFPEKLLNISDVPYALYVKGNLPNPCMKSVAIVGARSNSQYGEKYTLKYAEYLSAHGVQIISGMAMGIDGYAHRGALNANGQTFAVLANGVDICYPREHIGLYTDILAHGGGIISEQIPGTVPLRYHFPRRNRIISGLSDAVLIMEAKEKSGSLITADAALEQGKDIYALPGNQDSILSKGCNWLIGQGAGILLSPAELCENLGIFGENSINSFHKSEIILESDESLVYNQLSFAPKSLEELANATHFPISKLTALLITLELKGVIKEIAKHHYIKEIE